METFGLNIAGAIALVIPCHGVFLSAFFIIRSELKPGHNFLLGLMLLALSFLSFYELLGPFFAPRCLLCFPYYFYELLISPFLFLYLTFLIHPGFRNRIGLLLLIISCMMPIMVMTSTIINVISPQKMIYLSQLPKGFAIYYTYYKVLIQSEMHVKQLSHS